MDLVSTFAIIATIILLGFLSEQFFRKTNVPDVLILILVGVLLRWGFGWVTPETFGDGAALFTAFALVFILFQGALNVEFHELIATLSRTTGLTVLGFLLSGAVTTVIGLLFGFPLLNAILLGMVLGGTSSAIVIPLVNNLKLGPKARLTLLMESALTDVLCIVGALTVLKIIQTGNAHASDVVRSILASFSLAIVVGALVGVAWIWLLRHYRPLADAYMVTVAVVIALYAVVESPFIGASGAIAALAFGLVLGNALPVLRLVHKEERAAAELIRVAPEHLQTHSIVRDVISESAKRFYEEVGFFVKVFFFVYLGILIDLSHPMVFVYGAVLALALYLMRPLAVWLVFRKERLTVRDRTHLEIMIPKGLAAAVLAQFAVQTAIPGAAEVVNMVLAVIATSIILTSVLVFCTERGWFEGFWTPVLRLRHARKLRKGSASR